MSFLGGIANGIGNAFHGAENFVNNDIVHPVEQAASYAAHPLVQAAHSVVTNVQHPVRMIQSNYINAANLVHGAYQTPPSNRPIPAAMRPQVFPQYGATPATQALANQLMAQMEASARVHQDPALAVSQYDGAGPNYQLPVTRGQGLQDSYAQPDVLNRMYFHLTQPQNQMYANSGYALQRPGSYLQNFDQVDY